MIKQVNLSTWFARTDTVNSNVDNTGTTDDRNRSSTGIIDLGATTVLIDPETGKLIDIAEFNYFYDFAVGSNHIDWSSGYKMIIYNN